MITPSFALTATERVLPRTGNTAKVTNSSGVIAAINTLRIGGEAAGAAGIMSGYIQKINYWPFKLINAEITAFSK